MQLQSSPINSTDRPTISEYAEPATGTIEADLITQSSGQNLILGESLDATDQTEKVFHAFASNGQLLSSNLT